MSGVVILASNFPPMGGGISQLLYELAQAFPPDYVHVITLPTPGYRKFDERQRFQIYRLKVPGNWGSSSPQFKFFAPSYLMELLRIPHIDGILCGAAHHSLMIPAWVLSRLRKTPYAVYVHGRDLFHPQARTYRTLFNYFLLNCQAVIANSNATGQIAKSIGIPSKKIKVIHPIINPSDLIPKCSLEEFRKKYHLNQKKVILTVASLRELKGIDSVIMAMPAILKEIPEAHYIVVGGGPYAGRLKALVKSHELEEAVTFVGSIAHSDVADFYNACDLFVMTSRETTKKGEKKGFGEGFGIVYLEANLFGKAVVASKSGGVMDAVIHEETGLLVDPFDTKDIAAAVINLLKNWPLAQTYGANGRERVLKKFTGSAAVEKLMAALGLRMEIIDGHNGQSI